MALTCFINGALLIVFGALMALDAFLFPETARPFLDAALLNLLVGAFVCIAVSNRLSDLRHMHTFLLTASIWVVAALSGAMPLCFWGLSFTDAAFEAMSGITTTGSTVMTGLDTTPQGILIWRAVLQWIGGVGFIVAGIAFLPILRVGGMQLFRTESSERGEKEMSSAARFAGATVWVYLCLSALCAGVYMLGGMSIFDAIVHSMTTLSTGGYSNYDASFGHFDGAFLQWAGVVFMAAGGLPMAMWVRILKRRPWGSEQAPAFLLAALAATLVLTVWRVWTSDVPTTEALRYVAFNVMSVMTTTGFATTDYTLWGPFAAVLFFVLTAVGGCTGSTAGGVKFMRWVVLVRILKARTRMVHSPHAVAAVRYEGQVVEDDVLNGVMTFLVFFSLTVGLIAFGLGLYELDLATSVSGALTAVANVGPGVGPIIGPAGNFASLPDGAKWLLAFGMYAGRLEILTVFVILTAAFWREAV